MLQENSLLGLGMDIVQLRTLVHVAELGSLSKAADRLSIAQPALSRQLLKLEAELGAALFVRHGRGMVPTDLGHKVVELSARVFANLDEIQSLAHKSHTSIFGHVRLGMTPTVAEIMTLPLINAAHRAFPQLSLAFTTGFSGHLLDWLKRGEIDCCVAYDIEDMSMLRTLPVLEETLFLIGDSARNFNLDIPHTFASLKGERLLLPSPLHGLRRIIDAYARHAGLTLKAHIEADSFDALIDLAIAGFGLTILPIAALHFHIGAGRLSAATLKDPCPKRRVVMAYPIDRPLSVAARAVGDLFRSEAIELVRQDIWQGEVIESP